MSKKEFLFHCLRAGADIPPFSEIDARSPLKFFLMAFHFRESPTRGGVLSLPH